MLSSRFHCDCFLFLLFQYFIGIYCILLKDAIVCTISWPLIGLGTLVFLFQGVVIFVSYRRRSCSASSSGSSSSGSCSPKKAMKRISSTPPRKQVHHLDTSISPAGKDRRSPSPRARRGRGSASPPRSSGMIFIILSLISTHTKSWPHTGRHMTISATWLLLFHRN